MNESGWFHPPLPDMSERDIFYAHIASDGFSTDWERVLIDVMTGGKARFEFGELYSDPV